MEEQRHVRWVRFSRGGRQGDPELLDVRALDGLAAGVHDAHINRRRGR
jgi:hypothetical protein